jgi:hypothetical protein
MHYHNKGLIKLQNTTFLNMEKTDTSASFFKLFYNEEIYKVAEEKNYRHDTSPIENLVSENEVRYNALIDSFEGETSRTLILFSYPEGNEFPGKDKIFLGQVLSAVGLSFNIVSRLNTLSLPSNIKWGDIAAKSNAEYVICFGIDEKYMPAGIQEGQIYNIDNKRVLCTASLAELTSNNLRKKLLWQGLKEIYGL